jgi:signal transduction histidine kinase
VIRAIRNLIDNAERHAAKRIELTLTEVDGDAILTITNDGPTIPPDQQQEVFERFARLDDARTQHSGGTGLGLAIAREILQRHGGTITIDPNYKSGTRFIARIPANTS